MDTANSNAPRCASGETPKSGVLHLRTRLTANFTVIANALAQQPGSAVTVGVATYILSLPDGAPVSIAALCEHFTEGEILISRALRQLEAAGYLERRRERGPGGQVRTRTFAYDVPCQGQPRGARATPKPAPRPTPKPDPGPTPRPAPPDGPRDTFGRSRNAPQQPAAPLAPLTPLTPPAPPTDIPLPDPDPGAAVILTSLRISDPRLVLSRREVAQLAPAVAQWLEQGVDAQQITEALTVGLPDRFRSRPARILAFRLTEVPAALPTPAAARPGAPTVLPWQTCSGPCERPFRAAEPGRCRDCPPDDTRELAAAG